MKKITAFLPLLLCLCLLTGCGCKHEWKDATCTDAKTCNLCGITEGEALGHKWVDATCETAKTCSVCQTTEGEAAGHKWEDATTEAPKTCSVCQKTEGEKITTDERFKTANNKELFGTWKGIMKVSGTDLVDAGFHDNLEVEYVMTFKNDGTLEEKVTVLNEAAFKEAAVEYCITTTYALYKNQYGWSEAKTDEAFEDEYGLDVEMYYKTDFASVSYQGLYEVAATGGVYYIADGKLYGAEDWSDEMEEEGYTLTDDTLVLDSVKEVFPDLVFTRVTE